MLPLSTRYRLRSRIFLPPSPASQGADMCAFAPSLDRQRSLRRAWATHQGRTSAIQSSIVPRLREKEFFSFSISIQISAAFAFALPLVRIREVSRLTRLSVSTSSVSLYLVHTKAMRLHS